VGKAQVRALAERLRLPSAHKLASPCLASRVPYGTPVDPSTLDRVDRAERAARALGYRELRVRHHGDLGRLELGAPELERALEPGESTALEAAIRSAGYERAEIDREPFRSGRLNDALALRMPPASRA